MTALSEYLKSLGIAPPSGVDSFAVLDVVTPWAIKPEDIVELHFQEDSYYYTWRVLGLPYYDMSEQIWRVRAISGGNETRLRLSTRLAPNLLKKNIVVRRTTL